MMKRYLKNKVIAFALAGVMLFAGVPSDVYAEKSIADQMETGISPKEAEQDAEVEPGQEIDPQQDVGAEPEAETESEVISRESEDTEEWVYEVPAFAGGQEAETVGQGPESVGQETEPGAPALEPGEETPDAEPGEETQATEGTISTLKDGAFIDWRLDGEGTLTIAAHAPEPDRYTIDLYRLKSFDYLSEEERASISSIVFDGRDTCGRGFRVNGFDAAVFPNVRSLILEEGVTKFEQATYSEDMAAGFTNDSITSVEVRGEDVYLYVQLFRALETISVTGSVTNIFAGSCANLRQVTVNRWLGNAWQERAFMNCGSLTSFVVGETECDEISLDELFFFKCGALSELVIPSHLKEVGDCAFQNCSSLTNLPDLSRLTQIGRNAFGGCTSLAQITLPENIQIGQSAFSDCTGLLSVEIGSVDMSTPLAGVWAGCSSLQAFTIRGSGSSGVPLVLGNDSTRGNGNFHYTGCFENCSSLTEVQILAAVSEIGTDCFKNCENLTKLAGFTGLTVLDASCFENCSNLQVLPVMDTVQTIAGKAFYNCSALTDMMNLPALTQIGEYAFYGCAALTGLRAGGDSSTVIGNYVFKGCTSLTDVVFEEVQTIRGTGAFSGCTSLKQVALYVMHAPAELKGSTFEACSALTDLDIPAGFSQLSSDFTGCSSLETLAGLESLGSIRGAAFKNCSSLREIIFPDDAEMTGNTAEMFSGCSALERVVLPQNLTSLGDRMFQDCSRLTAVEGLENSEAVITIGSSCFGNCPMLKELRIKHASKIYSLPENLERFAVPAEITDISYLFRSCAKLREVTIPGTVTNMSGAFQNCPLLEKVIIEEGITAIPDNLLAGCTALTEVSLPETVTAIGAQAFSGCTALPRADLPDTVTQIGERAFENCTSLNQG
ncbi:MAG: leucine-rich repeat protein, partial [Eubacterium sp.]|nr:leucine-rich repeat protein [Eubacterium sp.]